MNTAALTPDDFENLLRWLDPDRDKAGEKLTKIQARLVSIFSSRGCIDPEFLTDKTTNIVMGKSGWLLENYVGDPAFVTVPVQGMLDPAYVSSRRRLIVDTAGPPPVAGNPAQAAGPAGRRRTRTLLPVGELAGPPAHAVDGHLQ